jgi:hypothetical protein
MGRTETLHNLQSAALATGDLSLFDQTTSELHADDPDVVNWRVQQALDGLHFPYRCPFCRITAPTFTASMLTRCRQRGYCTACWTSGFAVARRRIAFLEAALAKGFKAKALQFAQDAPQRAHLRAAYRTSQAALEALRNALDAATAGLPDHARDVQKRSLT